MNTRERQHESGAGSRLVDSVDKMLRVPIAGAVEMTGATWDLMREGVQRMTASSSDPETGSNGSATSSSAPASSSGQAWTSWLAGQNDQDLSGDDLKYVIYSIVFTKPGYECVLQSQTEDIVNYDADANTFAAVEIAKFLERARYGRNEKPEVFGERYPGDAATSRRTERTETSRAEPSGSSMSASGSARRSKDSENERGWRIPAEDQKYIHFLYRVDRRLPKQEAEVTRIERVSIENHH